MSQSAQALAALAVTLSVTFAAITILVSGYSRRAELVVRGGDGGREANRGRWAEALDLRLRRTGPGSKLSRWLQACGSPVNLLEFVGIIAAATVVSALFLLLFVGLIPAVVVACALCVAGGRAWGERRRGQRTEAFIQQLPELARTLSNGASAGLSMAGAVTLAARESSDPAATELGVVVQELRLGKPLTEALDELRSRLPSREVAVLVTTLAIQQRAGGDTVKALGELSETLEARKDLRREVRTLLAGTVYTSYLVAVMGVGTLVLLNVISPGVLREMTSQPLGIAAFVVAGLLWAIGFTLIRSMTKVEL